MINENEKWHEESPEEDTSGKMASMVIILVAIVASAMTTGAF